MIFSTVHLLHIKIVTIFYFEVDLYVIFKKRINFLLNYYGFYKNNLNSPSY